MNRKDLLTVTIGIPAHNEGKNIAKLLRAICAQQQTTFQLKALYVVCDGCTDQTAAKAISAISDQKYAHVLNDGLRKGQAQRLNELYQLCQSNIFITFDADIKILDPNLIEKLVAPFQDPKVGLVGGNDQPAPAQNFLQKALSYYEQVWKSITSQIQDGHNVHNHPGRISAVRTMLVKKHPLPENIVANDHYLYFFALQQKWKFIFAQDAVIYFQLPSTLAEFLLQASRFLNSQENIVKYFGPSVEAAYQIPRAMKLAAYRKYFFKNPILMLSALALQLIQQLSLPFLKSHGKKPLWHDITTSKEYLA